MAISLSILPVAGDQGWSKYGPPTSVFFAALAVAPVAIVLHELGHYGSQFLLGYQDIPFISYESATMGTAPDGPLWLIAGLSSAAGPIVSLLLLLVGVTVARVGGPAPLALGLVAFDCIRVLTALVFNGILDGDSPVAGLSDGFSELATPLYHLGSMGGAVLVSVIDLALPFAAAVLVYRALRDRNVQKVGAKFTIAAVGGFAGLALWLGVLGPIVLP